MSGLRLKSPDSQNRSTPTSCPTSPCLILAMKTWTVVWPSKIMRTSEVDQTVRFWPKILLFMSFFHSCDRVYFPPQKKFCKKNFNPLAPSYSLTSRYLLPISIESRWNFSFVIYRTKNLHFFIFSRNKPDSANFLRFCFLTTKSSILKKTSRPQVDSRTLFRQQPKNEVLNLTFQKKSEI